MEKKVTGCDDCPMCYYAEYGYSCTIGGDPDNRAKRPNTGEIIEKYPVDCPLLYSPITVVLIKE